MAPGLAATACDSAAEFIFQSSSTFESLARGKTDRKTVIRRRAPPGITTMTRRMTFAAPCALLLIIAGTTCVDCAIHPYTAARFTPTADAHVFRAGREGLFETTGSDHTKHDVKGDFAVKKAAHDSYVRFENVEFKRSRSHASQFSGGDSEGKSTGAVHAVLFELKDHFRIGYADPTDGRHHFCCDSADLVASTGCDMGEVLIAPPEDGREPESGWPWVRRVEFVGDHAVRTMTDQQVSLII
tara:strand:+ start:559 stop:1284 length:726 start_codon:yes stop_codon:yes gene_type:complete